jgi:hypothetical protein
MGGIKWERSVGLDAEKAEEEVRSNTPKLLFEDEKIELAFRDRGGKGRDKEYFTTHRILIEDGKGFGKKRVNYLSVPYDDIVCFSVQSVGGGFDKSSEFFIYTKTHSEIKIKFKAVAVDIFEVYQYLNSKISWRAPLGTTDVVDTTPPNMDQKQSSAGEFMDWLGDNAKQIEAGEVERMLKTSYPILLENETVTLAFQHGRDTTLFTDKRMVVIDVKGMSGKRIEFLTLLYDAINGFSVQTAGKYFDRDTEITVYTNLLDQNYKFEQDFRKNHANLFAIQKHLCNHVLGEDREVIEDIDASTGDGTDGIYGFLSRIGNNQEPIDKLALDATLHVSPPILLASETVELAFQGYRDLTVFTNKRLLTIDKKGLFGKKCEYFSVPWEKFVGFGIRSAGKFIDFDSEVLLYTEMGFYPGEAGHPGDENTPPRPPIPAQPKESCL